MVSVVNDACIKCKSCAEVCPVDAFHECETQLVVDPDVCIDCGVCISECPQEAITSDDEADEKWIKFNAEQAKICPGANEQSVWKDSKKSGSCAGFFYPCNSGNYKIHKGCAENKSNNEMYKRQTRRVRFMT